MASQKQHPLFLEFQLSDGRWLFIDTQDHLGESHWRPEMGGQFQVVRFSQPNTLHADLSGRFCCCVPNLLHLLLYSPSRSLVITWVAILHPLPFTPDSGYLVMSGYLLILISGDQYSYLVSEARMLHIPQYQGREIWARMLQSFSQTRNLTNQSEDLNKPVVRIFICMILIY